MYTRRNFIQTSALAAAGAMLAPKALFAKAPGELSSIGLQLFTLREELAKDVKTTIRKVAAVGYGNVETFYGYSGPAAAASFWGLDPKSFKQLLSDNNLRSYSGHYQLNDYLTRGNGKDDALKAQIEVAAEVGQQHFVIPVPPFALIDKLTAADYKFMAAQMNKAGELCKKSKLQLGYHNHFWEFKTQEGGKTGYDIMLEETEKDLVSFELDLFWITKAGFQPLDYFNKYPGRFTMWHVKDMDKAQSDPISRDSLDHGHVMNMAKSAKFAEVGTGSINFSSIFAAAKTAGLQHIFVEQDGIYMPDKFESIRQSYNYVKSNLALK
ncbi:sugar phosphate isomerase/epimerase family protein [Deminuibacter soli]|uniref:Sugar phosphate isomerase/epimerase n=1 Tax=Deminuibacter soli TaxID=2291815 RepID=A0A3E1NQ63_9BACT|nr:sugar phosphate isomerase/epimerase [Deminuibacter soli]RFM30089.1 sugar phosphate isomerase/epimerase [Deminuibacter soli]